LSVEGNLNFFADGILVHNCQNLLPWLNERRGAPFVVTVKLDGTSCTVFRTAERFGVCGRTLEWKDTGKNTYWNVAKRHNLQEKMPVGYALQAEMVGEGIQSNRMLLKGQDFYVFYVWDIEKGEYLPWDDMEKFVKDLGLNTVPLFERHFTLDHSLEQLLALADGPCPLNPKVPREGLVFRLDAPGPKVSFKAISNAYLGHYGL
jgi:RNA ligase (TIGR02306 family)